MVGIDKARQSQPHGQAVNRAARVRSIAPYKLFVNAEVLSEAVIRPFDLLVVLARIAVIAAPASQTIPQLIRVEMLLFFWQPWRVVRPDEPSGHPILLARDVRHARVDMVPPKLATSSFLQHGLRVTIELPEIMERRGG
jgi:hypothetical protein